MIPKLSPWQREKDSQQEEKLIFFLRFAFDSTSNDFVLNFSCNWNFLIVLYVVAIQSLGSQFPVTRKGETCFIDTCIKIFTERDAEGKTKIVFSITNSSTRFWWTRCCSTRLMHQTLTCVTFWSIVDWWRDEKNLKQKSRSTRSKENCLTEKNAFGWQLKMIWKLKNIARQRNLNFSEPLKN